MTNQPYQSNNKINQLLLDWRSLLQQWALDGSLLTAAQEALLLSGIPEGLQILINEWEATNFKSLPEVELLSAADINGALGAYATSTGKIYLNKNWLESASNADVFAVLTEELGHHLDGLFNEKDTPGDEGALFSSLVTASQPYSASFNYNDQNLIDINGQSVSVETSANQYETAVKSDTPLVYYRFEDSSSANSAAVIDSSVNNKHGVFTNVALATGKVGNAASFNNSSSFIDVPALGNYSSVTFEAWIKPTTKNSDSIYHTDSWSPGDVHIILADTILLFSVNGNGDHLFSISSTADAIPTDKWSHIVITYNSTSTNSNLKYYLNGDLRATLSSNNTPVNLTSANIGSFSNDRYFDGLIDEFAIYGTSLTPERISAHYNATIVTTAPTANLTSITDNAGSITGALTSGAKTDDTSLVLAGTNESGSSVAVYNGTSLLGNATVTSTSWTFTATILDGTTYNFNVKETDSAGNTSAATSDFTITGDTSAPRGSQGSYYGTDPAYSTPIQSDGTSLVFGIGDVGDKSTPSFVDIDNDGDLDLFYGNAAGNIVFFENTAAAGSNVPAFSAAQTDPFGFSDKTNVANLKNYPNYPSSFSNKGAYSTPTFGDIDADGDLDVFIGINNGDIQFWKNTGTPASPGFQYQSVVQATGANSTYHYQDTAYPELGPLKHDSIEQMKWIAKVFTRNTHTNKQTANKQMNTGTS